MQFSRNDETKAKKNDREKERNGKNNCGPNCVSINKKYIGRSRLDVFATVTL